MTEEEWKAVVGYEDAYEVSNLGRVRSLPRQVAGPGGSMRSRRGKLLTPTRLNTKVVRVTLSDGKANMVCISRLVYEAFIGDVPKGMRVYHKDKDMWNNIPDNLELATTSTISDRFHSRVPLKLMPDAVEQIRKDSREGRTIAKQLGVSEAHVSNIKANKSRILEYPTGYKFLKAPE